MALTFTDEQAKNLLALLGLPADTSDIDTILATVQDLADTSQGAPDQVAAARAAGLVTIDPTSLASLQAEATEGRTLKAAAARQEVEIEVDSAVRAGKIPPARREHWVGLVAADAELGKVLASMPANVIPVQELGHGGEPDADNDLTERADWFH
jgi:hypothetical protein